VLLVGGRDPDIRRLERATYQGRDVQPTVIIAGYGHVGSTVRDRLQHSTANCTVVDIDDGEEITVVGDVTEEESLRRAALEDATVFVVTIGDDDDAILATLLADRLVTGLDIIVRLDDPANEQKARRAGADYVLSLPELSGRVLAQDVLREERLSYSRQLETVRIDATPFAGRSLAEIGVLDTDCTVVAVERGDELLTDIGTTFTLEPDDRIIVVGSEEALETLRD
jgi:Trk K+ transport system NAD-binding subunit